MKSQKSTTGPQRVFRSFGGEISMIHFDHKSGSHHHLSHLDWIDCQNKTGWPSLLLRLQDGKFLITEATFFHNFSFIKKTEKFPSTFNGAHWERSRASTTRGNISILSGSAVYDGFDGVTHTSIHRHFAAQAFVKAAFRRIFSRLHHHYIIITWSASSHIVISLIMRRNENCEFDV